MDDRHVWRKIVKNEYRRCAVIESYESIKHILVYKILRNNSSDQTMVKSLFEDHIDVAVNQGRFTEAFSLTKLPEVHKCVLDLIKNLQAQKPDEVILESFTSQ